jgi:lipopolysaccharide export system protein LptC
MAWQDNTYSRFVAWMKIILPMAALATLATLFLISERFDPATTLPIAEIDLQQRAQDQGANNATFAGVTESGDEVVMRTEQARPVPGEERLIDAEIVEGEMRLKDGTEITMRAQEGLLNQSRYMAELSGDVAFDTSTGYRMRSEFMTARLDTLYAESPGPVTGVAPGGDLSAGRMVLQMDSGEAEPYLLFTGGVKLIYRPENTGD